MGFAIFMRERGTRKGVMKVGPFATKTKKEREAKREVFDLISTKKQVERNSQRTIGGYGTEGKG
jgi:hypothetical protein